MKKDTKTQTRKEISNEMRLARMNTYRVDYRVSKREDSGSDSYFICANRVEAWTNDYAFFGHPKFMDLVTHLIPRELVASVTLWIDEWGFGIAEGSDVLMATWKKPEDND